MIMNFWPIWIIFFYFFLCNIVKVNHFLYRFFLLLHLILSFLRNSSLLIPYAYVSIELIECILLPSFELKAILLNSSIKALCHVSIESIDCILLPSFELKPILLIFSVKTLCLSLLNLSFFLLDNALSSS